MLLVAVITLRTRLVAPGHPMFDRPWDVHKYLEMASAPAGDFHIAPFCWRIGLPWLAKAIPLPRVIGMGLLSLAALAATYALTYATARRIGLDRGASVMAVALLVATGSGSKLPVEALLMPDPTLLFFTVAITWATLAGHDRAVCALLAIGVCFKESAIFAAALHYALLATRPIDLARARRTLLAALPAVGVLLVIRLAIRPWNDDASYVAGLPERLWIVQEGSARYHYCSLITEVGLPRLLAPSLSGIRDLTIGVFGVLPLALIALRFRDLRPMLVRVAPFLALVYAQLLFAVSGRRLIALAAPIVTLMAARAVQGLAARTQTATIVWLPVPLALLAVLLARYDAIVLATSDQLVAIAAGGVMTVAAHFLTRRLWRPASAPALDGAPVSDRGPESDG